MQKGNFSPSDLRGLGPDILDFFSTPLSKYLSDRNPQSLEPYSEAVTTSIGVLLARLENSKLHHLWLENVDGKPEGLVTLTDIMNLFLKFNPPPPEPAADADGAENNQS